MNQIVRRDWLPERARWSYLARSGLPAASRKKNFLESHIINPLSAKLVRSRWLDIRLDSQLLFGKGARAPPPLFGEERRPDTKERLKSSLAGYWPRFFSACLWTPSRSINTQRKEIGQYSAILTSYLINKPYTPG